MNFSTVAAIDAALKRAADKHYRVLVIDTPPNLGVLTELESRQEKGGFRVLDTYGLNSALDPEGAGTVFGTTDPVMDHITSLKDQVGLLVICVHGSPSAAIQKVIAHAAAELGSSVGYASLSSLYKELSDAAGVAPAAIRPKVAAVPVPTALPSRPSTP